MARLRVSGKAIRERKKQFAKGWGAYGAGAGMVLGGIPGAAVGAGITAGLGAIHGSAYERQKARSIAKHKKQTKLRKASRFVLTGSSPAGFYPFLRTKKTKTT